MSISEIKVRRGSQLYKTFLSYEDYFEQDSRLTDIRDSATICALFYTHTNTHTKTDRPRERKLSILTKSALHLMAINFII